MAAAPTVSRARSIAFVITSLILGALGVLLLLFSLTAWTSPREEGIHRIHDVATGVVIGLLVGVPLVAQIRWRGIALAQLVALTTIAQVLAFGLVTASRGSAQSAVFVFLIALPLLPVALHPARAMLLRRTAPPSLSLLAISVAVGLVASPTIAGLIGEELAASPTADVHAGEVHYMTTALALAAPVLAGVLASLRTDGWRLVAWLAAAAATLMGVASVSFPTMPSSLGPTGGVVAIAWAVLFVAVAEREARRT